MRTGPGGRRAGEEAARRALCRAFHEQAPRLHRLAVRYLGRSDLAQDVVQETFVRALQALRAFRSEADVGTWLYRIAVNVCLDGVRAAGGRTHRPLEDAGELPGCPGGIHAVEDRQLGAAARRALDRLPDAQRLLVVLRDLEGLSYGEIARSTGASIGTVSSRLARARARLALALEEPAGGAARHGR